LRHLHQQTTTPDEGFVAQVATNSRSSDANFVSSALSLSLSPPCLPPAAPVISRGAGQKPGPIFSSVTPYVRNRSTSLFFFPKWRHCLKFLAKFPRFLKKKFAKIRPFFGEHVATNLSTAYSFKDPVQKYRQLRRNLSGDARQCCRVQQRAPKKK